MLRKFLLLSVNENIEELYIYNVCMYSLKHFTFNSFAEMQICRVNLKIRKMLRYKRCYKT